jgi:predicted transcriptional regulator
MHTKDLHSLYLQSPKLNQLNILREVGANARITQAELATRCSLSVAMVNNYMKDLCNSGLLEYKRKSVKSVTYHLTPAGDRHLETLQSELIGEMAEMFAGAKEHIRTRILNQANSALQRVVLYGSGNLAQLAFHALESAGIRVQGVCDDNPDRIGNDFCGREVVNPSQIQFIAPDAVIIADTLTSEDMDRHFNVLSQRGIELIYLEYNASGNPDDPYKTNPSLTSPSGTNNKPVGLSYS